MTAESVGEVPGGLRAIDRQLLGLQPDPVAPGVLWFDLVPHLCRTDGRFYGGAALAVALAAGEAVTGRPALWSSTQLVATATQGERVRVETLVVASGRSVDQIQVRGSVGDRLLFTAVGSTATPRSDGLSGTGPVMPRVPEPEACADWRGPGNVDWGLVPDIGHHRVVEYRAAPQHAAAPDRPGHLALWTRLRGDMAAARPGLSPAVLGFMADLVPLAICRACGVDGAGTSLDNSLRVGRPGDSDWVLLELDGHSAVGGYGHGHVHCWSQDGRLLATGTQSARLATAAEMLARRPRAR